MRVLIELDIADNINLTELEKEIKKANLPKQFIESYLDMKQDALCKVLAGAKNERKKGKFDYYYLSDKIKKLKTDFGTLNMKLLRVRKKDKSESIITPLLPHLVRGEKEISNIDKECLVLSKNMSYGKTKETLDFMKEGVNLSKTQIWTKSLKTSKLVKEKHQNIIKNKVFECVSSDGTKTHSSTNNKNEVKVSIGFKKNSLKPTFLGVTVNETWEKIKTELKKHMNPDTTILADGEKAISLSLSNENSEFQMCNRHFIMGIYYKLWQNGLKKGQAKPIVNKYEKIIYAMKNSISKYEIDYDDKRVEKRLKKSLDKITILAEELRVKGLKEAYKFVNSCKNNIFTYVRKQLQGIKIKYMSNDIERTMLEVGRRTKKKGMHWSKKGLETLLYSVLLSYFDKKQFYQILESI